MKISDRIKTVNISDIKPYDKNAKLHTNEQIDLLRRSLETYGYYSPIGIDKNNVVVFGHGRLEALKATGATEIEAVDLSSLSASEIKKLRILDNKIVSNEWDDALLQEEIEKIAEECDQELEEVAKELRLTDKDLQKLTQVTADEDNFEIPDEIKTDIKIGDLFQIGNHRLLCGDSTDAEQVSRLMNGEKADMIFTDPPYGMYLDAEGFAKMPKAKGTTAHNYKNVIGDSEDFKPELITTIFDNFNYCNEIFLWGADYYAEIIKNKNQGSFIVWDKRQEGGTDKLFGSSFELCWSKKKHKRDIARVLWAGYFGMSGEDTKSRVHPTQKPTKLVEWFLTKYGIENEIIADLYLGSGSTMVASHQLNRKCYGMELDPKYCQVIIDRMKALDSSIVINKIA